MKSSKSKTILATCLAAMTMLGCSQAAPATDGGKSDVGDANVIDGGGPDASADAAAGDASTPDASTPDADADAADADVIDAGNADAGNAADAGAGDASVDSGATGVCGDGVLDSNEACDDGNTTPGDGCSATCTVESGFTCSGAPSVCTTTCGDGIIAGTEDCDDGNLRNLDGCDSTCRYEVFTRMTSLAIAGTAAPAILGCTPSTNALGTQVLSSSVRAQLNSIIQAAIDGGTRNALQQWLGLDDRTGVDDASLSLGFVDAALDPSAGAWPGSSAIDGRFLIDPRTVGSTGLPTYTLGASLTAHQVVAGPGTIALPLFWDSSLATLSSAHLRAVVNVTPAPNAPPAPPTLSSSLVTFQTLSASGNGQGVCGNVTVATLAQIPVTTDLLNLCTGCPTAHPYTACTAGNSPSTSSCNSLLDVIVGGCSTSAACIPVVNPTQPDVAAGTVVTKLTLGTNSRVTQLVASDYDGYSVYLTFDANRAHASGEACSNASECITGLSCTAGVCR